MLTIRRTAGDIADVIASIPNVPRRVIPYAASTALTRVAQHAATQTLPAEMRKVFDSPVAYTLNALRTVPATTQTLSARIAVKDLAGGVPQEKYLLPEVQGGLRNRKKTEKALNYQGILRSGQFVVPGAGAELDANGNISGAHTRSLLTALKQAADGATPTGRGKNRLKKLAANLFAGKPLGGNRPSGIWRREGKRLRPLFVFVDKPPTYRPLLDFAGTVQRTAQERFRPEFERAVADILSKGPRA